MNGQLMIYDHQPSLPWVGARDTVLGVGEGIVGRYLRAAFGVVGSISGCRPLGACIDFAGAGR